MATLSRAHDVGWRIVRDWIAAQLAIIESGMVAPSEAFLPYLLTPAGTTLYQAYQESGLPLLLNP